MLKERLGVAMVADEDWFEFLHRAVTHDFRVVEFRIFDVSDAAKWRSQTFQASVRSYLQEHGLTAGVHSLVGTNLGEKVGRMRRVSEEILTEVMDLAEALGAGWVTTHLGSCGFPNDTESKLPRLDNARQVLKAALEKSGFRGLVGVENMPRKLPLIEKCILGDSPRELHYLLDGLDSARFGVVFDAGHANVNKETADSVSAFYRAVANRVIGFHVHGNNGLRDSHESVGEDDLMMARVLLDGLDRGTPFVLECMEFADNLISRERILRTAALVTGTAVA